MNPKFIIVLNNHKQIISTIVIGKGTFWNGDSKIHFEDLLHSNQIHFHIIQYFRAFKTSFKNPIQELLSVVIIKHES